LASRSPELPLFNRLVNDYHGFMPERSRITPEANSEASTHAPHQPVPKKDPAAVALGRRGGLKGGKARAAALTAEQRRESARKAAAARWTKHNKHQDGDD
jgi:hypothetical protein